MQATDSCALPSVQTKPLPKLRTASYRPPPLPPVKECLVFRSSTERTNYMRLLFALLFSCIAAAQTTQSTEPVIIIRAGTLIDGKSAQPLRNQVIVVRGNRIVSVGSNPGAEAAGAKTI